MTRANNAVMTALRRRVLVVDDEPIVRDVLERYLRRAAPGGYGRRWSSALDAFEARRPDLILLDLMLPGSTGSRCSAGARAAPAQR